MGGYYGLLVLMGVALLLATGQCDVSCRGTDGQAGINGARGRDGRRGEKGPKGEPADMANSLVDASSLLILRGEKGNRGAQGPMGPKGFQGDVGTVGRPGQPGPPGPDGRFGRGQQSSAQRRSAFSVIRTSRNYPPYDKVVTYQQTVVNEPQDFNINTGVFTCSVPGVYYFTFHSVAKVNMCLRIVSEALENRKLGFCNYNNRNLEQVLSGGVVLELTAGQKVWLESFREPQAANLAGDQNEKQIIFNGFLLF